MYFPIGWPKIIDCPTLLGEHTTDLCKISCDRVKILFAILSDDSLGIWYTKPCVPLVFHRRNPKSLIDHGKNSLVEWKPDSSMLVVVTEDGTLLLYTLGVVDSPKGVYNQIDSPQTNLRRDSAELFVKETIPQLTLNLTMKIPLFVKITCISCVNVSQMMLATKTGKILRIRWDNGVEERDFSLDLKRIPFSINQQVSYAVPILEDNTYITSMDYSPLVGGFAITLSDGRAAFLTANNLRFDPNQVQGIWAQNVDDATCTSFNHKYRLIAFGRKNAQAVVYTIDDLTGGLELSHTMILSAKDFPGSPGYVRELKWTPDSCAIIMSWSGGGISLWSTFGTMLMCSLGWDYGLNADLINNNPLNIISMDWSTEGYQLFMVKKQQQQTDKIITETTIVQLDFVKSVLSVNPCMNSNSHIFLQGDDKLYLNTGDSLQKIYHNCISSIDNNNDINSATSYFNDNTNYKHSNNNNNNINNNSNSNIFTNSYNICTNSYINGGKIVKTSNEDTTFGTLDDYEVGKSLTVTSMLTESKHWVIIQAPSSYSATNWPIRYSAIDNTGSNIVVAGRTGIAVYTMATRKWKLFGNETQEKDFIVTGGILWWQEFIIMGCYSLIHHTDELRIYPRDCKLDNRFAKIYQMAAPVMLINTFKDQLAVFTADGYVTIFIINRYDSQTIDLLKLHIYDLRNLCVHPACIVSVTLTNLRNESVSRLGGQLLSHHNQQQQQQQQQQHNQYQQQQQETIILNVSGRLLMVQKETNGNVPEQLTSTCLASCVECIWLCDSQRTHLRESLWLYCGGHGMRVWLPVFPRENENGHRSHRHNFMSKRIMLSFTLRVYPLTILFEDAIILGAENDTVLYTSNSLLHFSLPFCILERTSQVYLHQILRQLIRRNLGYNAWEIARSCTNLPYFPHSLELLLHEVLEEEATSKEPIPDALLPSVLEFIQEFPVYLQTVVQCARKTEIALWPYLFATAGKPKELFQQCLSTKQLETAASYLIILQNLEPSAVSRQYATLLLDTALEYKKWDLAKDLVRFLRAIDPNDVESPRTSFVMGQKFGLVQQAAPAVSPNAEDLSLILGSMARGRSFSTTMNPKQSDITTVSTAKEKSTIVDTSMVQKRKKSVPNTQKEKESSSAEEFFIDVILQRHARRLLQEKKLEDLGYMSASLDFHLVGWLGREKERAARIEDFVQALKQLHDDLDWPKPNFELKFDDKLQETLNNNNNEQESPSYSLQSLNIDTQIGTTACDSGYTSLPQLYNNNNINNLNLNTPTTPTEINTSETTIFSTQSTNNNNNSNQSNNISSLYNPTLSNIALMNMNLKNLNINDDADQHKTVGTTKKLSQQQQQKHSSSSESYDHSIILKRQYSSDIENNNNNNNNNKKLQIAHNDNISCASEQLSLWDDDNLRTILPELDNNHNIGTNNTMKKNQNNINNKNKNKLEIKLRYLLQIFTEANCLDYSLLLSIILLDNASILRIINIAIRSNSLSICRQLRNGLKDITRWSFNECLGYRLFMLKLQNQILLLDRYVIQQESIPNFITPQSSANNTLLTQIPSPTLINASTPILGTVGGGSVVGGGSNMVAATAATTTAAALQVKFSEQNNLLTTTNTVGRKKHYQQHQQYQHNTLKRTNSDGYNSLGGHQSVQSSTSTSITTIHNNINDNKINENLINIDNCSNTNDNISNNNLIIDKQITLDNKETNGCIIM